MSGWRSANVLESGAGGRRLWQLAADSGQFTITKDTGLLLNESPPRSVVGKDWQELVRKKLNIAWVPADKVFLRAAQFPTSDPVEIRSMIELQLEKLSPLPVTHAVWSFHLLPKPADKPESLQTVIVVIASRNFVEEFLADLEGIGFLADRLECPALEELLAAGISEDGVWIFPGGEGHPAIVVWQQGGVIQNLSLVLLQAGPARADQLKTQLEQVAWAAELEGWLPGPPVVHLVVAKSDAAYWETAFRDWSNHPVDLRAPTPPAKLAALGAQRCASGDAGSNLMPVEFASRYRQQFVDGLWMRAVFVVLGVYLAAVLMYFGALYSLRLALQKEQSDINAYAQQYTEAQKDKAEIDILKKRADLQYAALDAWKAVAENLPDGLTINDLDFRGGKLDLHGTAPADDQDAIYAFNESLRHANKTGSDQPLFKDVTTPHMSSTQAQTEWNFSSTTVGEETP